jgi:hypothetical protein
MCSFGASVLPSKSHTQSPCPHLSPTCPARIPNLITTSLVSAMQSLLMLSGIVPSCQPSLIEDLPRIHLNSSWQTYTLCIYDLSFLEGEKHHSHTLKAGKHLFPFSLALPSSILLPSTSTSSSFISYKLRTTTVRPGLAHNLHASHPVAVPRSFAVDSLE